jgi:hypothetical protein
MNMSGRSSIESLRRLSPVSDVEAAAVFGATGRDDLLTGVVRQPCGRGAWIRRVTHRRRPLVLALALVAAAATAAGAWAVLHGSSAQETTSVQCLIGTSDAIIPSTSGDPTHDCATDYRREFGTAAPPLVAYDNTHGGVTVLPQSEKPPAGWRTLRSQDVALIELQDSLDDYIAGLNSSCLDGAGATALANAKLARFGFTGWTVTVRNSGSSGPGTCVDADVVDPATQTVTLISIGGVAGPDTTEQKLADKLRPLTQSCESLPAAVAAVRAAASSLGLSESAHTYELNAVTDDRLRCASVYETVGGTTFLTVRGPNG